MSDREARAQEAHDTIAEIHEDPALEMEYLFGRTVSRETSTPPCPECEQVKCGNCDGTSWNPSTDDVDRCPCAVAGHRV